MYKLILSITAIIFISCSSDDTTVSNLEQNLYENNKFEDYELFERANRNISLNQLDLALVEIDKINVLYPSSSYSNKGMLLAAYIHFLKEDYEKTRAIAENFKKYYPGNKDIVYANYLDAMTYYVLIKKPNYSQKNAKDALNKFNFILNAYPGNVYEIDIITKINILDNNLAASKLSTAKFYMNKKNVNGALIYLKDIYENHSSSLSIEETLYHLSKIYNSLSEIEISKSYAAILAYNFPNSIWYEKSYNLINDIQTNQDKENWYNKYNPIKLFINNQIEDDLKVKKIN